MTALSQPNTDMLVIYVFRAGDTDKFALSSDETGANLPCTSQQWVRFGELADIDLQDDHPQAMLEVSEYGYCLLEGLPGKGDGP